MKIITSPRVINSIALNMIASGKSIGFVPTMGALHDGHISLIRKAKKENDLVVVSIFINPKQFSNGEDYNIYPRDMLHDRRKAISAGCDILFCPKEQHMYGKDFSTSVEVTGLSNLMCGKSRQGHFKGVATVCLKLFNIVMPHKAYFGQKDYQQAVIIKKMVQDLGMNIKIKVLPTVRESSGLAMSSRNSYLNLSEKDTAAIIYKSLKQAKRAVSAGQKQSATIISGISGALKNNNMIIDYVKITDLVHLEDVEQIRGKALIAVAAKIGKTRLIDNILVCAK